MPLDAIWGKLFPMDEARDGVPFETKLGAANEGRSKGKAF